MSGYLTISSATLQSTLFGAVRASRALKKSGRSATVAGMPPYIWKRSLATIILLNTLKAASWFLLCFKIAKVSPWSFAVILPLIVGITAISQCSFCRSKQQVHQVWEWLIATLPDG